MPYKFAFTRTVSIGDRSRYNNNCCVCGDVVLEWLRPELERLYGAIELHQEDWGWHTSFSRGRDELAIEVATKFPIPGIFRLFVISRVRWPLLGQVVLDTEELDFLRDVVLTRLKAWPVWALKCYRVDEDYRPTHEAPGVRWEPPVLPEYLRPKQRGGQRPTEFLYRGHRIVIAVSAVPANGRWVWIAEIDDSVIVTMGNGDGARSRDAAIDAAMTEAKTTIEGMQG